MIQKWIPMKTILKTLAVLASLVVMSANAHALPSWKEGMPYTAAALQNLNKKSDFEQLKPGEKVVLVCKSSSSVMLIDIKDKKQAMKLCESGKMHHCSDCKKDYKVIWNNPTGKGWGPSYNMSFVNAQGEPCMFMAKLK